MELDLAKADSVELAKRVQAGSLQLDEIPSMKRSEVRALLGEAPGDDDRSQFAEKSTTETSVAEEKPKAAKPEKKKSAAAKKGGK